jgi:hypothetical protein
MLSLQVVAPDRITERYEVPPVLPRAGDETLDGGTKERPGATGRFKQVYLAQVAVGGVPGEIEQHLDDPSAREHLTVVLDA